MSGEQFQQWSQGSPLLSLDRFHLKQTPVLNFNYRDSLGFPSYILHKKTFFSAWFAFSSVASLNFSLPKWLALHLFKCLHHFSFRCQSGLLSMTKKGLRHCSFLLPWWAFLGPQGSIWILVGGHWGPIGNSLGSLPLGFFWGSLFFLGLWEHPKFRGSLFFGTTLE